MERKPFSYFNAEHRTQVPKLRLALEDYFLSIQQTIAHFVNENGPVPLQVKVVRDNKFSDFAFLSMLNFDDPRLADEMQEIEWCLWDNLPAVGPHPIGIENEVPEWIDDESLNQETAEYFWYRLGVALIEHSDVVVMLDKMQAYYRFEPLGSEAMFIVSDRKAASAVKLAFSNV